MESKTQRLVCNIPSDLMTRINKYCDGLGVNRTSGVIFLLVNALDVKDGMTNMVKVEELLRDLNSKDFK